MFTGLIEGQGRIESMEKRGGDVLFRFHPLFAWDSPEIGESVACNGVCLTMETWIPSGPSFTAFASAETLSCSNLGGLAVGGLVNMERAMAMGERFGGHIVSGHVDTVARVESVNECGPGFLEVNIIPETWRVTTVASWKSGSAVNLETDVIGKYVKHLMQPYGGSRGSAPEERVTMDFLRRNGFGF